MSRWIDKMPASERAELVDAGRIGSSRFEGPRKPTPEVIKRRGFRWVQRLGCSIFGCDRPRSPWCERCGRIEHFT